MKGSQDKPIFITGCDTGFGKNLALELAKDGWKVYAACLSQAAGDALKKEVSD
jgi:NAD(P)-dependent dehydrogenase (short-subunit alcohol dehydrogenase family)